MEGWVQTIDRILADISLVGIIAAAVSAS